MNVPVYLDTIIILLLILLVGMLLILRNDIRKLTRITDEAVLNDESLDW